MTARKVVVLAGGISHERDVSLRSGRRVADSLQHRGHAVTVRDPDANLLSALKEDQPELVWPALHGASGEDGALRALLDTLGIPYVGSQPGSSRLAWHKPTAKVLIARAGIATAESITLPRDTFRELGAAQVLDQVVERFGTELVVKPAMGGSAQGVTVVHSADELRRAVIDAYTYGEVALIEKRVFGTEVAAGIIDVGEGPEVLPIVEIEPRRGVYGYDDRYVAGETRFYTPARLDDAATRAVRETALAAHNTLALRHLSRIDLIVTAEGVPYFLEANVFPGLTETSLVPQAILADGRDLGQTYEQIGEVALRDFAGQ